MYAYISVLCLLFTLQQQSLVDASASQCQPQNCLITNNCRCSSKDSPLSLEETPQLIVLTFDEAVLEDLYSNLWQPLLFERKNPDGGRISGTFFVPHEYTDYSRVQDLYVRGFEIGVNSITKNGSVEYWATAPLETLIKEFEGQRKIVSHFANIPLEDIVGARAPMLQIEGDVLIGAYEVAGVQYDSSWTSRSTAPFFPYTLDYLSLQECRSDTFCPKASHPGFWIAPINNIKGEEGAECNALNACKYRGTPREIADWLLSNIQHVRTTSKAPQTLMMESAWFRSVANSYEGFELFLDEILSLDDVFFVSHKQVIDWSRNPVPLKEFKTDSPSRTRDCNKVTCALYNADNDIKYMTSCIVPCPKRYPWLENPLGD